jgi:hypothetical protein
MGLAAFSYLRGPIAAPDWVRDRVDQGLDRAFAGADVAYQGLEFRLDSDGRPQVSVRNMVVRDTDGRMLAEFFEASAALSMQGLLRGVVQPKRVTLSGAVVDVRRGPSGRIELGLGEGLQYQGSGTTQGIEALLALPVAQELETLAVDNVTLRYEDLRAKRSWTVDGGRLNMTVGPGEVTMRGDLALLSGRASVATLEANATLNRASREFGFGLAFSDMPSTDLASQSPALAWLGILDAPISGAMRGGFDSQGQLLPVSATLQIGAGALQPEDGTRAIGFRSAGVYLAYDPQDGELRFDEVALDSDLLRAQASGVTRLTLAENGLPDRFEGAFDLTNLTGPEGEVWPAEVSLDRGRMAFDMQLAPFRLHLSEARLEKGDLAFDLQGDVQGQADGWSMVLNGQTQLLPHDSLIQFWPPQAMTPTRDWLAANIRDAVYHDLTVGVQAAPGQRAQVTLDTRFAEAEIRYAPTMTAAKQVSGELQIADNGLTVAADTGVIAPITGRGLNAAGTEFRIPAFAWADTMGEVSLRAQGPLPAALALLAEIPGLARDDAYLRDLGEGMVSLSGSLTLPVGRVPLAQDYDYSIDAVLTGVRSTSILRDLELTSDTLTVRATPDGVQVRGPARLGDVVADVTWTSGGAGNGSAVDATVTLSQAFAEEFNLGLPEGTVSGQSPAALQVDMPQDGPPQFTLTSDLKGLGLGLPFINWAKPSADAGLLEVSGQVTEPVVVDRLSIDAAGFVAEGRVTMLPEGGLDELTFDRLQIGGWLDAPLRVVGRGPGVAPDIVIDGGTVDIPKMSRTITRGTAPASAANIEGRLIARLDRLVLTEAIALTNMNGDFAIQGLSGSFEGRLNDQVDVLGTVALVPTGRKITLSSDDAGAVFAALGLLRKASQGDIWIELTEAEQGYHGQFRAANVVLHDMPAMAQLLNAVSVVGLLDQMNHNGIVFAEVEGDFYFSDQQFLLTRAAATGPSMGLSLDGTYDLERGTLDMQGVISPAYLVNGLGGFLNRKGEGLIGISFQVQGPADNPQIIANPLSALTPGIFREIFRKAAPEAPE